jgi:S-formylglutathione hydrolase FrmB
VTPEMATQQQAWGEYAAHQQGELGRLVNTFGSVSGPTGHAYDVLDHAHRLVQGVCGNSDHYSRQQLTNLRQALDDLEQWLDEQPSR